jgi:site-specific recombinase XerC
MQISHARQQYVDWPVSRELSPHTIRANSGDIVAFESHLGGEAHVGTIVSDRIAEFIAAPRERGLSPMSMRRRAAGVRGFCRWFVSRALLQTDPGFAGRPSRVGKLQTRAPFMLMPLGRRRCAPLESYRVWSLFVPNRYQSEEI